MSAWTKTWMRSRMPSSLSWGEGQPKFALQRRESARVEPANVQILASRIGRTPTHGSRTAKQTTKPPLGT